MSSPESSLHTPDTIETDVYTPSTKYYHGEINKALRTLIGLDAENGLRKYLARNRDRAQAVFSDPNSITTVELPYTEQTHDKK